MTGLRIKLWWIIWAACPVILRFLSTGVPESGDGVMHFLIAKFAWAHPALFLDHWGKPLFTLLSSPFAQFGVKSMAVFNALCFLATCHGADVVLRDRSPLGRWLFAPLLMCMPVYGAMVFSGLTEILFASLTVLSVAALWQGRYMRSMVVASFLPFARPEYVAVWPFLAGWVLWQKQWKALPGLLAGHVCYGILGGLVFKDPLWAFTHDPYTGAQEVYGHGPLLHFIDQIDRIYGTPFLLALAVALILAALSVRKPGEGRRSTIRLTVTALLPVLGIVVVHSVLWWKGWKGSLGLTRVLATGAPLGALFVCAMLVLPERLASLSILPRKSIGIVGGGIYIAWAMRAFLQEHPLPVHDSPVERVARVVGDAVADLAEAHHRVVHAPPMVTLFSGIDPFDTSATSAGTYLGTNDLLVWDAAYGPNEGRMPLPELLADTTLELLRVIVPEERWIVLGGNPMEYFLFAKRPSIRTVTCEPIWKHGTYAISSARSRCDSLPCGPSGSSGTNTLCLADSEYPLEVAELRWDLTDLLYAQINVSGVSSARIRFVVEEHSAQERTSYWAQDADPGNFNMEFRIPPQDPTMYRNFYMINLDRTPITLTGFEVEVCFTRRARGL